ncbi:hypothetical protein BDZ97DRAFT_1916852 [Flammula alnicola]|nr:hypothetical protein BDZ97DRAFT_1916852 [Flammula alnicola]
MSIDVDDTSPAISYSSGWQAVSGTTSQQFDSTIHQSSVHGASATITFSGTRISLYNTVPAGTGTECISTDMDGHLGSMCRTSHPDTTYYQDGWFDSGPMTDGLHTLVAYNNGVDGGTPLMIDRFNIIGSGPIMSQQPTTVVPVRAPATTTQVATITVSTTARGASQARSISSSRSLSSSSSSSTSGSLTSGSSSTPMNLSSSTKVQPSGGSTVVSIQYITTAADSRVSGSGTLASPTSSAGSSDSPVGASSKGLPIGAVVGIVIGGLLILLVLLLSLCLLRRRRAGSHIVLNDDAEKQVGSRPRNTTRVTPFRLEDRTTLAQDPDGNAFNQINTGLAAKGSQTSSSIHRAPSTAASNTSTSHLMAIPPSEKSLDASSPLSPSSSNSPISSSSPATSPSYGIVETDAGPFRPLYLSGDTVIAGPSSSMYASVLVPIDSNDIPPSYQSARQRSSYLPTSHQTASINNSP